MADDGDRQAVLAGVRRLLERQVEAGRRYVRDGELARRLVEEPPVVAPGVAEPPAGTAPPAGAPPRRVAPAAPAAAAPRVATPARSTLDRATRARRLAETEARARECVRCPLHRGRTQVVFGTGDPDADLLFVGEAPGREEDRQGEPFVGRAGQLLTRIIEAIDLKRSQVYIANVVKCRPPENRNPAANEITMCSPFLHEQIELVAPKVICALGRFASMTLLGSSLPLARMRGRLHEYRGVPVVVTYHPAALLRYQSLKRPTWEDMQVVQKVLAGDGQAAWVCS